MATLPTRLVEIEFDAGVWTDVSSDFVELGTRRGRNRESGAFETGKLTMRLRNDTRKYDPDHATGPYYGKLRPNRRVRFRATYNAVTYPVYQGYIDRITQEYEGPNAASVIFDVSDLFKLLNRAELPVSAFAAEVAADTPAIWFRLGEPSGVSSVFDTVGGVAAPIYGTPTLAATGLVTRDDDTAMSTPDRASGAGSSTTALNMTGPPITLAMIIKTTDAAAGAGIRLVDSWGYQVAELSISSPNPFLQVFNSAGTGYSTVGAVSVTDGNPHLVVGTWDGSNNLTVYVDGVATGAPAVATGPFNTIKGVTIGGGMPGRTGAVVGTIATFDEAIVFGSTPSAARIAAWSAARATPWNGDLPGTRIGRILDLAAVPAADRNLDAGTTTLQASSLGGTALGYAQTVEETDAGELFVARDGKVRYIARNNLVTGTYLTSQATLVDDDSGAGIPYRQSGADVDEAVIVTRATVSRDGSVAVTYFDAAAKAEFGWLDETHEGLLHNSDAYSLSYAQWVVNTHKAPSTRVGAVQLELTKDPVNMYPAILALEIGDRVTYKKKPQNTGAVMSLPMRVEAIAHETGPHYWRTTLQLSPFDLAGYPVFVWDTTRWDQHVWGM